MSDKQYEDVNGNPITLYLLVRSEPNWAVSRILEGEKAAARVAELEGRLESLDVEMDKLTAEYSAMAKVLKQYADAVELATETLEEMNRG